MKDKKSHGQPSAIRMDENVERIQELINRDKCLCIHDLHEKINLSNDTSQSLLL
jgi:hypothetical protein